MAKLNKDAASGEAATEVQDAGKDTANAAESRDTQPEIQVESLEDILAKLGEDAVVDDTAAGARTVEQDRADASERREAGPETQAERLDGITAKLNKDAASGDVAVEAHASRQITAAAVESQETRPDNLVESLQDILEKLKEDATPAEFAFQMERFHNIMAKMNKDAGSGEAATEIKNSGKDTAESQNSGKDKADAVESAETQSEIQVESLEDILAKLGDTAADAQNVGQDTADASERREARPETQVESLEDILARLDQGDISADEPPDAQSDKNMDAPAEQIETSEADLSPPPAASPHQVPKVERHEDAASADASVEIQDAGKHKPDAAESRETQPEIQVERLEDILAKLGEDAIADDNAEVAQEAGPDAADASERREAGPEPQTQRFENIMAKSTGGAASGNIAAEASPVAEKTDMDETVENGLPKRISNFQVAQRRAANKAAEASVSKPLRVSGFQRFRSPPLGSSSSQNAAQDHAEQEEENSEISRFNFHTRLQNSSSSSVAAPEKVFKDSKPEPAGLRVHEEGLPVKKEMPSQPARPARKSAFSRYLQK